MPLFDDRPRHDSAFATYGEDSFSFLNRVDGPMWARVRDVLEDWFADYSRLARPEKAADLRARFRNADPRQHFPAWWELYVFRLLRVAFPDHCVVPERELPDGSTGPDFAVIRQPDDSCAMYVEAVQPVTGIKDEERDTAREAVVFDAINEIDERRFFVHLSFVKVGPQHPRKRKVTTPIVEWLRDLDPDAVQAKYDRTGELETLSVSEEGWEIELRAIPRSPANRTQPARLIGMGPGRSGYVSDVSDVRAALKQKARRHRLLDAPFVIAVMPSSPFFDDDSAVSVLYGSEAVAFLRGDPDSVTVVRRSDGYWTPDAQQVTGVLLGPGILPWTVAKALPTLWLNPYAAEALPSRALPVRLVHVDEKGGLAASDPPQSAADLFALPPDWPRHDDEDL